MSKHSRLLAAGAAALCLGVVAYAQNTQKKAEVPKKPAAKAAAAPADESADERDIRASADAFVKAYNAHDAKAIAAMFAMKAEIIDESGQLTKGREAIEKSFAEVFQAQPQAAMAIRVDSVRILTPNIAVEEGIVRGRPQADQPENVSGYVAVHVKVEGKWVLASVRDFEAPSENLTPHDRLRELEWLIGEWVDESPEAVVESSVRWSEDGNFLLQDFKVHVQGVVALSGTMRIGWDGALRQFRSWVFDSTGGHSEGAWNRDGDEWIVKSQGVTSTGESASATGVYRPIDRDTIGWRMYDRTAGGERGLDVPEVVVKRRPPKPAE